MWDIRRSGSLYTLDQFHTASAAATKAALPPTAKARSAPGSGSASQQLLPTASAVAPASSAPGASGVLSHSGSITHLQYSSDGRWLYSSGTDGRLRRWDMSGGGGGGGSGGSTRTPTNTLVNFAGTQNTQRINRFCLSRDNRYVFYPNGWKVWALSSLL